MPDWKQPTAAKNLLFCPLRLETREDRTGPPLGCGTGFVVEHQFTRGFPELFIVTNKHVIQEAPVAVAYFTSAQDDGTPDIGDAFYADVTSFGDGGWHPHPNTAIDVCVLPFARGLATLSLRHRRGIFLTRIPSAKLAGVEHLADLDALQPIAFAGFPSGLYDTKNHMPIFRQGTTATPPFLDFEGEPLFLIDASVFPGSSGSPVFSYDLSIQGRVIDYRVLGLVQSVWEEQTPGQFEWVPVPTRVVPHVSFQQRLNLGGVLKAPLILEAIRDYGIGRGLEDAA